MFEINRHFFPDCCQSPVYGIEKCVLTDIILWSDPFALQNTPPLFGNIQMWRIWGKIEKIKTTMFPKFTELLYFAIPMDTGIIKNNKCILINLERECIKKFNDLVPLMLSVVQNSS